MIYLYITLGLIVTFAIAVLVIRRYNQKNMKTESFEILLPEVLRMSYPFFDDYLNVLDKIYKYPTSHFVVNFRQVEMITYPAYMILMAQIEKVFCKGAYPSIKVNRRMLDSLSKMEKINYLSSHHVHLYKPAKVKEQFKNRCATLNPQFISSVESDLKRINVCDYYDLNTLITELMGNAVEHGIKDHDISWWLYHKYYSSGQKVNIVFLDMGNGILHSYKEAGLPEKYLYYNDESLLLAALNGELGSSTKMDGRGRGLPQIKNMVVKNQISDFILITNTVYLQYEDERFITHRLQRCFYGTYYSFSVNRNNYLRWEQTKR